MSGKSPWILAWAAAATVAGACSGAVSADTSKDGAISDAAYVCPQTIAAVCAQPYRPTNTVGVHCASTLSAAETDTAFCMTSLVTESTCGTLTVIVVGGVDFAFEYYYDASGALIAITTDDLLTGQQCLAGNGTFATPHAACTETRPLPACASDGGGAG
jgi:hypothetical protein